MRSIHTRKAALQILLRSERSGAYTSDLLARAARSKAIHLPLLQRLVKGTLEWRNRIDAAVEAILGRPITRLSPTARNILRIAGYQILFLERVPLDKVIAESLALLSDESPAVRESVETTIRSLRKEPRGGSRSTRPTEPAEIAGYYSHPEWLVRRLIAEIGHNETARFCDSNNHAWPVAIRAHTLKISPHQLAKRLAREGVITKPGRYSPECLIIEKLPRGQRLDRLEAFSQGLFQVQDESAQLIGHLVGPVPHQLVIDLCAAPGGKATHLAVLMRDRGEVIALDRNAERTKSITQNARRLSLSSVRVKTGDAASFRHNRLADRVLLDAPCSGFGVLGRKSDIRWSKSESDIDQLVELQTSLIEHAASLVAPGGILVYSTCTIDRAENEDIVNSFLKRHPEFSVAPLPDSIGAAVRTPEGFLRTWPHKHRIGGAFGAALRKSGQGSERSRNESASRRGVGNERKNRR